MDLSDKTKQFIGNISVEKLLEQSMSKDSDNVVAMVVPHAGYYFSGDVAATGYNQIEDDYDNIFIIGTSHKTNFRGAAIFNMDDYFGLKLNREISKDLLNENDNFFENIEVFKDDHNIEIHLPFLKIKQPNTPIIPIMVGGINRRSLYSISNTLKKYFNGKNLFIVSSDLSHYPSFYDAMKIDYKSIKSILSLNVDVFKKHLDKGDNINGLVTKMCGWSSIFILLNILEQIGDISGKVLMYKNSGHVNNEKESVVGYSSIVFTSEKLRNNFKLSYSDKVDLMDISRKTLDIFINDNEIIDIDYSKLSNNLKKKVGSFVTLKKNGNLRGCIGLFSSNNFLVDVVKNMTIASSSNDNRFEKVTPEELDDIEIEISVLTPFKKIESIDEIELGKHGIYIEKDGKTGTYLPQVATETGWDLNQFLGNCSKTKVGIGWDGWKDANIFIYEAIVFGENELYKEASYYEKLDKKKVKCNLCPHYCTISDGKLGSCLARKNIEGRLYSLGYNNPGVVGAIDPVEKKPLRHFNPGRMIYSLSCNGCNFHCDNCQNDGISQVPKIDKSHNIKPIDVVKDCLNKGLDMISFTYTEPTIYFEYMLDIAKLSKDNGISTVMVSNGYINDEPLQELLPYLDAANIDLKFFDPVIHKKITKGRLEPVLSTIKTLFDNGIHLEITNLIIEDINDNDDVVSDMYQWIVDNGMVDIPIHLIRFFPAYKMKDKKHTSKEVIDRIRNIALSKGIRNIYG